MTEYPALIVLIIAVISVLLAEAPVRVRVSASVLQVMFGIAAGPHGLGLLVPSDVLIWLSEVGMASLFFMTGIELDLNGLKGRPLSLALRSWFLSLALGLMVGGLLYELSVIQAPVLVGLALTTTSLGLLVPILSDAGDIRTAFGRLMIAAATVGEFGPIIALSLFLTTQFTRWEQAGLMLVFIALACVIAVAALNVKLPGLLRLLARTMNSSAQLPVLLSLLLLAVLSVLAHEFGLEIVLGGFAAGMVIGLASRTEDGRLLRVKIEAVCYGFFAPFFFVVSGMKLDVSALLDSRRSMLLVPIFLVLFLVVRGGPALLYGTNLARTDRWPFVLYSSTGLPMVLVIAQRGVEAGVMSTEIAAALVGAALLSALIFPTVATTLLARAPLTGELSGEPDQLKVTPDPSNQVIKGH